MTQFQFHSFDGNKTVARIRNASTQEMLLGPRENCHW